MAKTIRAVDFTTTIQSLLQEYGSQAADALSGAVTEVTKEAAGKLRSASRSAFGSGPYASGWKSQVKESRFSAEGVVYGGPRTSNKAHLLEFGHVTRNGTGRTFAPTPAHEHIAPVNDWAQSELIARTQRKLEGV